MTPAGLLAAARVLAARQGRQLPVGLRLVALAGASPRYDHPVVPEDAGPEVLGLLHEAGLAAVDRRRRGAHYTPLALAGRLVRFALDEGADIPVVCDPAVGGGSFLLAAAQELVHRGFEARMVAGCLHGSDLDPLAVAVTEAAIWLWAMDAGAGAGAVSPAALRRRLVVADGRLATPSTWGRRRGFDLVVGNPPFRAQRRAVTARAAPERAALAARFGSLIGPHTDDAVAFQLAALDLVRDGGRVALVVPESTLGTRDTQAARDDLAARAELVGLWQAREQVFAASVRVCCPVLQRGRSPGVVRPVLAEGGEVRTLGRGTGPPQPGAPWGPLLPSHRLPSLRGWRAEGRLGDLTTATAGYRDQYYGIADAVRDRVAPGPRRMPLVTSGAIGPAELTWGEQPTRYAHRRWDAPVVDLDRLEAGSPVARWAEARVGPKVLVATQTRVLEAVADERGWWYPSVPVLALSCRARDRWAVLAVVLAPPVSVWAHEQAAGTALGADAIKLRAGQLLDVPLPGDPDAWRAGAVSARAAQRERDPDRRRAHLLETGRRMTAAYGLRAKPASAVVEWWAERLGPVRRGPVR